MSALVALAGRIEAVEDAAVLEGEGMSACNWAVLATLRGQIAVLEQRIGQLVAVHPDSGLWASLPGAGAALLPRFSPVAQLCNTPFRE